MAVQTLDGLHSAPGGVPGGEAGLAEESGLPTWPLGLGLVSAVALAMAGRRLVPARQAQLSTQPSTQRSTQRSTLR